MIRPLVAITANVLTPNSIQIKLTRGENQSNRGKQSEERRLCHQSTNLTHMHMASSRESNPGHIGAKVKYLEKLLCHVTEEDKHEHLVPKEIRKVTDVRR